MFWEWTPACRYGRRWNQSSRHRLCDSLPLKDRRSQFALRAKEDVPAILFELLARPRPAGIAEVGYRGIYGRGWGGGGVAKEGMARGPWNQAGVRVTRGNSFLDFSDESRQYLPLDHPPLPAPVPEADQGADVWACDVCQALVDLDVAAREVGAEVPIHAAPPVIRKSPERNTMEYGEKLSC